MIKLKKLDNQLEVQVGNQFSTQLTQLENNLRNYIDYEFLDKLWDQLIIQLWSQFEESLEND